ncbi:hypothetical protein NMY22_g2941 [Coprinellus aureogranulatus]|nr:hypothetical protein NMY22_g2941 [Coprinellus aureogranulatus]
MMTMTDSSYMEDFDEDDEEGVSLVALKVVSPRNLWEYHVLRRLHSALPPNLRRSVVLPHALYAFSDESFLVMDYCPQGMLLDLVNNSASAGISQAGACLDELLVVFSPSSFSGYLRECWYRLRARRFFEDRTTVLIRFWEDGGRGRLRFMGGGKMKRMESA